MAVMQGTFVQKYMNLKNSGDDTPIDITGWEFRASLRTAVNSDLSLVDMSNASGGFVIVDGANGRLAFTLTEDDTLALPVGRIYFDVLRVDPVDGPIWLFGGSFLVKQPVTRGFNV